MDLRKLAELFRDRGLHGAPVDLTLVRVAEVLEAYADELDWQEADKVSLARELAERAFKK